MAASSVIITIGTAMLFASQYPKENEPPKTVIRHGNYCQGVASKVLVGMRKVQSKPEVAQSGHFAYVVN